MDLGQLDAGRRLLDTHFPNPNTKELFYFYWPT
jgi:hypothetical protein